MSSPPSQPGSTPLIEMPTTANKELKTSVAVTDWRSIFFAPAKSPAPIRCATWTENPVAAAAHNPQNSHVVVETNPMEAAAFAPRLPTIEASIYCMAMEDTCAIIAGTLRYAVRRNCCPSVILFPSRISDNK